MTMKELVIERDKIEAALADLYKCAREALTSETYYYYSDKIDKEQPELTKVLEQMTKLARMGQGFRYYKIHTQHHGIIRVKGTCITHISHWFERVHPEKVAGANIVEVKEDGSKLLFADFYLYAVDYKAA